MSSTSYTEKCRQCGNPDAVGFSESKNLDEIPEYMGSCYICGYQWFQYEDGIRFDEELSGLDEINELRKWADDRNKQKHPLPPKRNRIEPYTEEEYKNVIKYWTTKGSQGYYGTNYSEDLIWDGMFGAEGDSHEHEHEHEHDGEMDPDDLIYSLDKLTEFAISYIDEGGFGGESLGREVDKKRDLIIETIRYVEGSIELNIIYDMKENPLSLRFAWTDNDFSPIIYLPPPVFLARTPDEIMEHDH